MPNPNYKVRLKNFLFNRCSRKNRRVRLFDDKQTLFDEIFCELMLLEEEVKKAPLKSVSPDHKKNGPQNPEEILYWHFNTGSHPNCFIYLPDWSGFSKADLIYFKSKFEQLMGDLT